MQPSDFNMVAHKLEVIRTYDGEDTLQVLIKPSPAQLGIFPNSAVYAGRCLHFNSSRQGELGVGGHQVPLWLFRQTDRPSGGFNGTPATSATVLSWQDGTSGSFLGFVGMPGLELGTTEYDPNQTYAINDLLCAKLYTDSSLTTNALKLQYAGVVTNQSAISGAAKWGRDPIVGVVSNLDKSSPHQGLSLLKFYTVYMPPIEALVASTPGGGTNP